MCDICKNESPDSSDVGVAAVPAAPVSLMWCQNCLKANAVPLFVVEVWLFQPFWESPDNGGVPMPSKPPKYPLAAWTDEMTVWLDGTYVPLPNAYPLLWEREYERLEAEKV